jgi:hypothetical protein
MRALRQILNISPDEDARILLLAAGWALIVGFTISGKAARDAIFLSRYDRSYLPLMVVAIAICVALAVALCSRLARVARPRQILAAFGAVVAGSMVLFRSGLEGWRIPALYVWVEVANVILGLEFWLMASDLVDSRQAKRLFALIAGGGSLTAVLVGSQLKGLVKVHGAAGLLPLMAAFTLAAGMVGVLAGRLPTVAQPQPRRRKIDSRRRFDGYLTSIAIVVCAAAVASTLVDYQFKIVAASSIHSEADLVGFFGMFSAATGFSTLIFQFVLTGRILSRAGIVAGLALLPLGLGAGSAYLLLSPVLAAAVLAKFSDGTLKFTVHNAGLECLWVPVPYVRRQMVKPWINGTLKSSAEGLSGLATFFLVKAVPLPFLSLVVLAACAVWVWTLVRMKGFYSRALEEALRSRSLEYGDLQLDAQDSAVVATVDRSLRSGDPLEQIFALELIRDMPPGPWTTTLRSLLAEGTPEVQKEVLDIAGDDARVIPDHMIVDAIDAQAPVAELAVRAGVRRGLKELAPRLEQRSSHPDPGLRAACARALHQFGADPERQEQVLHAMLNGREPEQLAALRALADAPALLTDDMVAGFFRSPSPRAREAALQITGARGAVNLIPLALDCLADREIAIAARAALLQLPREPVAEQMANRLVTGALTTEQRVAHIRALRYLPPQTAYPLLCGELTEDDPSVRVQVPESLLVLSRHAEPPPDVLKQVETRSRAWIHSAYYATESLRLLPANGAATLLRDYFHHAYLDSLSGLLKLLALRRPSIPVEACVQIVTAADKARLAFVLDLLDSFLPIAERKRVLPLFEPSEAARSEAGRRLFQDLPRSAADVAERSIRSKRDWEQAIGLDYSFREESASLSHHPGTLPCAGPITAEVLAQALRTRPDIWIMDASTIAAAVEQRKTLMYSTLEKTIILKSASLFSAIAAETLSRVAQLAEEVSFTAGSTVYREGDPGTALYVVASGAVTITLGAMELAVLRRGEPFGEVAVLNRDVYRAGVRAAEDTVLLRIEQDDLFELMQANGEIMRGIIGLLARRVAQVGDLLREPERSCAAKP